MLVWCNQITLTQNPFNIDVICLKGYEDPEYITTFVKQYADIEEIFRSRMFEKINDFYVVLNWSQPVMNTLMDSFFTF